MIRLPAVFVPAVLAALCSAVLAAPVAVTGTMTYTQNFSSLGTGSTAWVNDSTLPGWYAQMNNGATAPGTVQASNGTSSSQTGLLNLGATGAADRALGSKATSTGGFANIAYAVQFRNTGASPVQVSQIAYTGELWRTNTSEGGLAETYTVFYAVSSAPVTNILSGPTAPVAVAGSGFAPLGTGADWSSPNNLPINTALDGNAAANRTSVSFVHDSLIVNPGEYLMIKWTDTNLAGADGYQGVDDVSVQFTSLAGVPEIVVEQPALTNIADGGTSGFGSVRLNGSASLTFGIRNAGTATLTGLAVTIDGPNAADFAVTAAPSASLSGPGGTTAFTVRFTPASIGSKLALVHIANNDSNENPFDIILTGTVPPPGEVDAAFNPNADGPVYGAAIQLDGKIVVAGGFSNMGSVSRNGLARLNADGSVDAGFNPGGDPGFAGLMADGRMFVGGNISSIGGVSRRGIALLNADGSVVTSFNAGLNWDVNGFAFQQDGKILLGGGFSMAGGSARSGLVRFNPAGALDTGFNVTMTRYPHCMAVQPDGKILIGGEFTSISGTARRNFARLHANGSLDTSFIGNTEGVPYDMALQADGKVIVVGTFVRVGGPNGDQTARNRIARFNVDGTVDATYNPNASAFVGSVSVQADGKAIIGGTFTTVGGVSRSSVARLHPGGSVDTSFTAQAARFDTPSVNTTLAPDGRVILTGAFTSINGIARNNIARVENDAATQSLTVPSATRVQWLRDGSSPETQWVDFQVSTNGGSLWLPLGTGTRIDGGWERTGFSLPASGMIRARTVVPSGSFASVLESVTAFSLNPEIAVEQPPGTDLIDGTVVVGFGNADPGADVTLSFLIRNTGPDELNGVGLSFTGTNAAEFTPVVSPAAIVPSGGSTVFSVRFAPATPGSKSAILRIASNDSDENPFDISLTGTGLTALEAWRQTHFGTILNTGDAADNADPDKDGLENPVEFGFALNPNVPDAPSLPLWQLSDDEYTLTFTRPANVSGITYVAEYSTSLAPGSWTTVPNSSTQPNYSFLAPAVTQRLYLRLRVTVP